MAGAGIVGDMLNRVDTAYRAVATCCWCAIRRKRLARYLVTGTEIDAAGASGLRPYYRIRRQRLVIASDRPRYQLRCKALRN